MKVILLRNQRIMHKAGEIVEVSPEVYNFLINTNSAIPAKEAVKAVETKPTRKRGK